MGQRPGVAGTVAGGLHEVTERAARAGDHEIWRFAGDRTLAMNPHGFALVVARGDAVMAAVPEQADLGTKAVGETLGDECAIRLRPAEGVVVFAQICRAGRRFRRHPFAAMHADVRPQDGFAQAA